MKQQDHQPMNERKTNIWHTEPNLRKDRKKAGYSTIEFAKLIGMPKGRLNAIENNQISITVPEVELIAQTLGVDVEYIMVGIKVTYFNRYLAEKRKRVKLE